MTDLSKLAASRKTWGTVFSHYKAKGCDPSDAAYHADQWEKRQHSDRWKHCCSTHCERSEECRSPHECTASLAYLKGQSDD